MILKQRYSRITLGRLCQLFGITRQAYYQHSWYLEMLGFEQQLILKQVLHIRKKHPRMGGRKLYQLLEPFMLEHQIKMGRDALFDFLATNKLLVRRRKRKIFTTNSFHWLRKYPNLIRGFKPLKINQLWVSDITYWKTAIGVFYISFITDAFSHKIVGYHLSESLAAKTCVVALEMALSVLTQPVKELIHHSDRGVQYCSANYVNLLQDYQIQISMTENGDPLENAIAERVNGIIKDEYLLDYQVNSMQQARAKLTQAVQLYNQERPHMSIGNLTPNYVHQNNIKTEKLWKNYYQDRQKNNCSKFV
jgi:transposase InsO family protein